MRDADIVAIPIGRAARWTPKSRASDAVWIVLTPGQTIAACHLKVSAYSGAMFVILAAAARCIEPQARSVQFAIGTVVACHVAKQLAFQFAGHRLPMLFRRTGRRRLDVLGVTHVHAADPASAAVRDGWQSRFVKFWHPHGWSRPVRLFFRDESEGKVMTPSVVANSSP